MRNLGLSYENDAADFNASKTDIRVDRYRTFVAKHPTQTSYFQPILDVLEYRPSALETIPDVVMFEGKNDFYATKYMDGVILNYGAQFGILPGTGAGTLATLIQLYIAWGREFLVLLDSDSQGSKEKARYIEKFGRLVENRIFTLSDVESTWSKKGMERLFEEEDLLNIQKAVEADSEKYRKASFNRAVQELNAARTTTSITDASQGRFRTLLDFFTEKFKENSRGDS